jgi:RNA polymerase sigma-70 factor (ECF subfamily)
VDIATLFEEYEQRLYTFAVGLTRDEDNADDLVQETMIRAMGHLDLLGQLNRHQRRAWLLRTLKNLFIDDERRRRRQIRLVEQLSIGVRTNHAVDDVQLLAQIIRTAPVQYRELLHQRYLLGLNSQEIAAEEGVPPATIRSRLHMARQWLKQNRDDLFP